MEKQDYFRKELDKDLLFLNNKIYGPETCIFIERSVNVFISEQRTKVAELPVGVYYDTSRGAYKSACFSVEDGKQKTLGRFSSPEEAHEAWLAFKLKQAHILAQQQTDERVAKALIDRYENYRNLTKAA
ncbi:MAG: hypothetical protein EOO06_00865 [Chitinophagaceae bacterium]|nr:MAG: hypothetical protein EOO06_00865 [Chitinophagaceae bacterium]